MEEAETTSTTDDAAQFPFPSSWPILHLHSHHILEPQDSIPSSPNQKPQVFQPIMLRALSTRRSHSKYEKLVDDSSVGLLGGELRRSNTLPVQYLGSSGGGHKLANLEVKLPALPPPPVKPAKKSSKTHPLFSFFDTRRKKRTTSRPEFARYIEYVKEGGRWDKSSGMPVIY